MVLRGTVWGVGYDNPDEYPIKHTYVDLLLEGAEKLVRVFSTLKAPEYKKAIDAMHNKRPLEWII